MLQGRVLSVSPKMASDCHRNSGSRGTSHRLKASKTQRPLPKGFLRRHRLESPDVHVVTRLAASGCIRDRICCRVRSEEHTSELQSHHDLVCRLLLEKK